MKQSCTNGTMASMTTTRVLYYITTSSTANSFSIKHMVEVGLT